MMALRPRDFHDVLFTCFDECILFAFPRVIENLALHINALELFVLVMAAKIWAPKLADFRFRATATRPFRWCARVVHVMPSRSVA